MQHFLNLVADEVADVFRPDPPIASFYEGYALLAVELEQYWSLVRSKAPDRAALLRELVDIATMAMAVAEDTGLLWDGNAREPLGGAESPSIAHGSDDA